MRIVAVVAITLGVVSHARADKARECYLEALRQPPPAPPAPQVKPVGCFEKIKATEDHAYGYRACFVVADGACAGLLAVYDANIEPDQALFDDLKCGGKDGAVSFVVSRKWKTSFEQVGPHKLELAFSGKVSGGALRGTLTEAGAKAPIVWKATKRDPNVLEQVRLLTAVAKCAATK